MATMSTLNTAMYVHAWILMEVVVEDLDLQVTVRVKLIGLEMTFATTKTTTPNAPLMVTIAAVRM